MLYDVDKLDIELRKTEAGSRLLKVFNAHVDEVFYLVGHHRQVMVAWQRYQGPAFVAGFLGSGTSPDVAFKKMINGIHVTTLIRRMAVALQDAGSPALRKAIGDHIALIMEWTEACNSMNEVLERLKATEALSGEISFS
jgi:hypothetical protein